MFSRNMSPQSKSFIILSLIAVVGAYLALAMLDSASRPGSGDFPKSASGYQTIVYKKPNTRSFDPSVLSAMTALPEQEMTQDTNNWKTYTNEKLGLAFRLKPDWRVLPPKEKDGFTLLEIDPGKQFYNIQVYVSNADFYAMDSLLPVEQTIAGKTAYNVSNILYGIRENGFYYTFDIGKSLTLIADFMAMVHSVEFR